MALRNLRQRRLSSTLTALGVALGVALVVLVSLLRDEAREAFSRTAVGVEILVGGNKGGRIDTLLSALYHVGRAPGRIAMAYFHDLRDDPRVSSAIPIAVGDHYRGLPVVGTSAEFLERFGLTGFGGPRHAVAGSLTGLRKGDVFHPSHGGFTHKDESFTVSAVARPTGTAHDRALWIDIEDFLHLDGHAGMERGEQEHDAISAILLRTKSGSPFIVEPLIKEINDGNEAQALRPMQVLGELFALVATVHRILNWVAALVVVVAATSVMVALYNTMFERRREVALLRALGASRSRVFWIVLLEAGLICLGGALFGLALGHGGAYLAAPLVEARAGVRLDSLGVAAQEPLLLLILFVVGCAAGIAPALRAYRTDVAADLA